MKDPAFKAKIARGPMVTLYVKAGGGFDMPGTLARWFGLHLVVSIAGRLPVQPHAAVRRGLPDRIPRGRVHGVPGHRRRHADPLDLVWTEVVQLREEPVDSLVYGLVAGGVFGWLWPR